MLAIVTGAAAGIVAGLVSDAAYRWLVRMARWNRLSAGIHQFTLNPGCNWIETLALWHQRLGIRDSIGIWLHGLIPERHLNRACLSAGGLDRSETKVKLARSGVMLGLGSGVCWLACGLIVGKGLAAILVMMVSLGLGVVAPVVWLVARARKRSQLAVGELGEMVDWLVCCTDAGLALAPSLDIVIDRLTGVLGEELKTQMQRSVAAGGAASALRQVSKRLEHPALKVVLTAIVYAERLGTPLSQMLKRHSTMLATMRRQSMQLHIGQKNAQLTICTIVCLLPATLAMVVVPNVIGLLHTHW